MAVVQGIKEKVHLPLYDSVTVEAEEQLRKNQGSSILKFFVDVQGKTKLETNMQSASQLSHYNTFEARAMRVIISDMAPEFPSEPTAEDTEYDVVDDSDNEHPFFLDITIPATPRIGAVNFVIDPATGTLNPVPVPGKFDPGFVFDPTFANSKPIRADVEIGLDRIVELLQEAEESGDGFAALYPDDDEVTLTANGNVLTDTQEDTVAGYGGIIWLSTGDLEFLLGELSDERAVPPRFQLEGNSGVTKFINKFIYNTVTTFYVGEKVMIQMPTWFFPSGAGTNNGHAASHGEPDPMATFRFAEAIFIDKQQNFRVEIEIPDSDLLKELQRVYGPLFIWVVLDGYMTRDVQ
ncbi:MAG: hypothetical protein HUU32_05955 [Calditrichaceae bacterium]|nr:hypothetical protein [Calditrichia bacterium]NUQ40921.1 hypothetical protein [Calditrichaceae bacterium]